MAAVYGGGRGQQASARSARADVPVASDLDNLLPRVARGDQAAFAAVFDQVAAPVYGVVSRIISDNGRSQQVTEQVLTQIWQSASRFDPSAGSGLSWVLGLARRCANSEVRARASGQDGPRERPGDSREDLADGLSDLSQMQRQALVLAVHGGWTARGIADRLDVPLSQVSVLLREGLLKARA